jgi:hypothetical protein
LIQINPSGIGLSYFKPTAPLSLPQLPECVRQLKKKKFVHSKTKNQDHEKGNQEAGPQQGNSQFS